MQITQHLHSYLITKKIIVMEANQILQADILDIIFEGKNKSYGAYALRRAYNSRIIKSLFITFLIILGFYGGTILAGKKTISTGPEILITKMGHVPENIPQPKIPELPKVPEAKQAAIEKAITNIYVPPRIMADDLVRPDEKVTALNPDAAIGTEDIKIGNKIAIIQPPTKEVGTEVADFGNVAPQVKDEIFIKVEKEAEFDGGPSAWRKYLVRKLNPQEPAEQGAEPGLYTVIVRFVVSIDGSISDVVAETNNGFGMEKDAITVIKNGPNWIPAMQNGSVVKAYRRQPITFQVL